MKFIETLTKWAKGSETVHQAVLDEPAVAAKAGDESLVHDLEGLDVEEAEVDGGGVLHLLALLAEVALLHVGGGADGGDRGGGGRAGGHHPLGNGRRPAGHHV